MAAGSQVSNGDGAQSLDTSQIKSWRSIITLILFVFSNIIVLFPFHIPIYVPRVLHEQCLRALGAMRIISLKRDQSNARNVESKSKRWVVYMFPMNFITAPLISALFLLAILAIGRREVHDGTIGAQNISPIDVMVFFITLAYIAISIDASGLIRFLALKVLQTAGKAGRRLYFYLYAFFFILATFIGNDPIILSGTPFLAYLTRVSSNIHLPTAWVYMEFAVSNIASAILVSSNPTNLVLAGAFNVKFIEYTANMIVPAVVTGITLFPFLLFVVFREEALIPRSITMHELTEEEMTREPTNPNIPYSRGAAELEQDGMLEDDEKNRLSLEEIMNPYLDKAGAWFGSLIMAATLIIVLALNAALHGKNHVFWITLPAATVMLCWDLIAGWRHRHETREISRKGKEDLDQAMEERERHLVSSPVNHTSHGKSTSRPAENVPAANSAAIEPNVEGQEEITAVQESAIPIPEDVVMDEKSKKIETEAKSPVNPEKQVSPTSAETHYDSKPKTLESIITDNWKWARATFPTATTVLNHLPIALVPFAFSMFVLVQALVTKGWVPVFAHGWDHWVNKTGTIGAIGGMGFLSVILCNFAGTNIGTTILLSRVIQSWQEIHRQNGIPISERTFWATVYAMALGVNYGAFSIAFSAALAGLLWRDILSRKHIHVRELDFARINAPIIAFTMIIGSAVLAGQVYITRGTGPYDA